MATITKGFRSVEYFFTRDQRRHIPAICNPLTWSSRCSSL